VATTVQPCPACGIEGEADAAEVNLVCPYCGNEWHAPRVPGTLRRLPVAPPAPTRTAFCSAVVDLGNIAHGAAFYLDGNSKITAGNGTYADPAPNAFSLPAASVEGVAQILGIDGPRGRVRSRACPGSTEVCRESCYVRGLAKHAPEIYDRYRTNAHWLGRFLQSDRDAFRAALALATWIRGHAAAGFRWHVSGDVWNEAHAEWIVNVAMLAPDVPMWIYTRTLAVVSTLRAARNLAVNVSADRENYAEARRCAQATGARLTYLVGDATRPHCETCGTLSRNAANSAWVCECGALWSHDREYCVNEYADTLRHGGPFPIAPGAGVPADLPPGSVVFPDYALRGRDLDEPTTAPWWQALSHEQRAMVCPTDFFGQSEAHRCGPCGKCL
jgi:hypothetical protein